MTACDIRIANRMQARIPNTIQKPVRKRILDKSDEIEIVLKSIAPESDLADWDKWDDLTKLFSILTAIKGLKLAGATKILHKKRPHLIPILDSVIVEKYVRKVSQDSSLENEDYAKRATACCKVMQKDLRGNHNALSTIQCNVKKTDGIKLSPVRILDILLWLKYR